MATFVFGNMSEQLPYPRTARPGQPSSGAKQALVTAGVCGRPWTSRRCGSRRPTRFTAVHLASVDFAVASLETSPPFVPTVEYESSRLTVLSPSRLLHPHPQETDDLLTFPHGKIGKQKKAARSKRKAPRPSRSAALTSVRVDFVWFEDDVADLDAYTSEYRRKNAKARRQLCVEMEERVVNRRDLHDCNKDFVVEYIASVGIPAHVLCIAIAFIHYYSAYGLGSTRPSLASGSKFHRFLPAC